MKKRCLVVDDEPLAQKIIESYIERIPFLKHIQSCDNAFEALGYLHEKTIDILFLDINMPELSGLDLLKTLEQPPPVILTTAYSEYGVQSYDYNVIDYLLKPISFERFLKAINKLAAYKNTVQTPSFPNPSKIIIEYKGGHKKIMVTDILYVEAYGNFCKIYLANSSSYLLWSISLKKAMEQLSNTSFMRVHRSYIINKQQIELIQKNWIVVTNRNSVPIGKSYKRAVLDQLL